MGGVLTERRREEIRGLFRKMCEESRYIYLLDFARLTENGKSGKTDMRVIPDPPSATLNACTMEVLSVYHI